MTTNNQHLKNELQRIHSYTCALSALAANGTMVKLETTSLEQIFADIARITAWAYAELDEMAVLESDYIDPCDRPVK